MLGRENARLGNKVSSFSIAGVGRREEKGKWLLRGEGRGRERKHFAPGGQSETKKEDE